ncbi:MAG: CDP-alcohol phosphatidyltransferase family protein [Anaerolineales bacterium]|nr:CDP-alcohol phosphatidyltransferase family protein [Anaerolineales bacterium]
MKWSNLKFLIPNGITFTSLAVGLGALMEAAEENLVLAGLMIFISYWLDMADGFTARKLDAASDFGLQLDSLVDMICFGAAPAVLVFQHLRIQGGSLSWIVPLVICYATVGAFRLARFNLLPPKAASNKDSTGLAITQAGGTTAVGVLADLLRDGGLLPVWGYIPLMLILAGLMASTIGFPPVTWFVRNRWAGFGMLIGVSLLVLLVSTFATLFILFSFYLLAAVMRSIYHLLSRRQLE